LLGSVYFLNGTAEKLKAAYDHESKDLESWQTSVPSEIANQQDMQLHLGDISHVIQANLLATTFTDT
jgi:hypothetical protein